MPKRRNVCQYVDDQGGCQRAAVVVLRLLGQAAITIGKRRMCEVHRAHCMSNETRARGREWQIDRHLKRSAEEID